jgi:16S rRNA (guanine1516-N2)-methyltransferase
MGKPNSCLGLFVKSDVKEVKDVYYGIAETYQMPVLTHVPSQGVFLVADDRGVGLCDASLLKQAPVYAEFCSTEMQYRLQSSTVKSEIIMRAIGNKQAPWHVIDATPGLGRDAMIMAHFGCKVTLLERSSAVACLLADGLRQIKVSNGDVIQQLQLYLCDSIATLNKQILDEKGIASPDVVYLDPMFPHKKKSALVKKDMQLLQKLLGDDADADNLLPAALEVAKRRVVVKRPNYAEPLNHLPPNMSIKGKKYRFDVYFTI